MTEGEKSPTKRKAGSGAVGSEPSDNAGNIERRVEDLFRKFEAKPEIGDRHQKISDDLPEIKVEIAGKDIEAPAAEKNIRKAATGKDVHKPRPGKSRPKKFRPVYAAGAVLLAAAAAVAYLVMQPRQAAAPLRSPVAETVHTIVQSVPTLSIQPQEKQPAPPVPESIRQSEEIEAFLMKWKAAWENTAGKQGDMETFMSFYSDSFSSTGMNKSEWQIDKIQKNRAKDWIRLELKNILIGRPIADDRIKVSFLLNYGSSNYSDETYQTLVLKKEADDWKIIEIKATSE